jgi:Rieske Fe-S protein
MSEDQERFEDYLELEHYIEELQAGYVAHPPGELTPDQARIYRMVALFRAAGPEGAEPRPEFAAELRARLEQELEQSSSTQKMAAIQDRRFGQVQKRSSGVSRRALLAGGAVAAASMVVGAGIEHIADRAGNGQAVLPPRSAGTGTLRNTPLISRDVPTTWYFVTTVAELSHNVVRFATDAVVGYVIRADDDADVQDRGKIIAMSAACTHMGCLVHWQGSDRKFHCPCHGRRFTEYGLIDNAGPNYYVNPLPRLETKVEDGKVYVKVPVVQKS